jgi:tRNA dimethylallyltransferase
MTPATEVVTTGEPPLVAIVGPTAVGKTAVAVALAERLDGEIISADAVAVYRGLDIGAAKPDADERARATFHLIDVADPDEDFTVADFARLAEAATAEIRSRGKVPIVVGGTGLYVRALTATLSMPEVPAQEDFRAARWAEVAASGSEGLHDRLRAVDPESAEKISPRDAKKIIRALEVYHATGRPLSSFHTPEGVRGVPKPNTVQFGLTMDRERLYRRIEARVDAMLAAGFLDEVRGLLAAGYGPELKSMGSLGYRHLCAHLRGEASLEVAGEDLKRDTRRYAKRQWIWFRADARVTWLDVEGGDDHVPGGEAAGNDFESPGLSRTGFQCEDSPPRGASKAAPKAEAVADTIVRRLALGQAGGR